MLGIELAEPLERRGGFVLLALTQEDVRQAGLPVGLFAVQPQGRFIFLGGGRELVLPGQRGSQRESSIAPRATRNTARPVTGWGVNNQACSGWVPGSGRAWAIHPLLSATRVRVAWARC